MRPSRDRRKPAWDQIFDDLRGLQADNPEPGGEERVLCSDEACIGLVGEDGRCRLCGRAYEIGPEQASEQPVSEEAAVEEEPEDEEEQTGDFSERVLCSDGGCIGLVGADGYCKLCGLRWKPGGYEEGEEWVYQEDPEGPTRG